MSEMTTNDEPTRTPAARRAVLRPQTTPDIPPLSQAGPAPAPPRISGATILIALLIVVVLGSILGSCFLVYSMVTCVADLPGRVIGGVREALDAGDPTYSTLPAVIEQLRPLSRLETQEYFVSTVVEATKPRLISGLGEEKLVLIACGRVIAGVDLSKIQDEDIQSSGSTVRIKLPPPEVFETMLDEESGCTYVYDHSHPIFTEPNHATSRLTRNLFIRSGELCPRRTRRTRQYLWGCQVVYPRQCGGHPFDGDRAGASSEYGRGWPPQGQDAGGFSANRYEPRRSNPVPADRVRRSAQAEQRFRTIITS